MGCSFVLFLFFFFVLEESLEADIVYSVSPPDYNRCNLLTSRSDANFFNCFAEKCEHLESFESGADNSAFDACTDDCYDASVSTALDKERKRKEKARTECIVEEDALHLSRKATAISRTSLKRFGLPVRGPSDGRRLCAFSDLRIPRVDTTMITFSSSGGFSLDKTPGYLIDVLPDKVDLVGADAQEIENALNELNHWIKSTSPLSHCLGGNCLNTKHFYFKRCFKKYGYQEGRPASCYYAAAQMLDDNCWSHCESWLCTEACGDAFKHKCIKIFGTRINCGDLDRCRDRCHRKCAN